MEDSASALGSGLEDVIAAERPLVAQEVYAVGSMLSYDERALLHWSTRAGYPSAGAVVDAGCFLGGSTLALAKGIQAGGREGDRLIDVYDLFRFGSDSDRTWVPEGFAFEVGGSTMDVFEHNVSAVRPLLRVHEGDVREVTWGAEPIGVLFVDIAKSWDTGDAVWREFLPAVSPGGLVIQQDLVHWGHPWCAIAMELLADHFEYLGWVWFSSAVYRCVSPVPAAQVPGSLLRDLTLDRKLELLDGAAARIGEPAAASLRLSGAVVLASHGRFAEARQRIAEVRSTHDDSVLPYVEEGFAYLDVWVADVEAGRSEVA